MYIASKRMRLLVNSLSTAIAKRPIAFPIVPNDGQVRFYKRDRSDFGFLSNFYVAAVVIDGVTWPHTEAYYQAQKSDNPEYHARILEKEKPSWSKYVGDSRLGHPQLARESWFRDHPEDIRDDWDDVKLKVMEKAIQSKFTQHQHLRSSLISTGDSEIIEDSSSDYFWGCGEDGSGSNWLGRLLMAQRENLQRR